MRRKIKTLDRNIVKLHDYLRPQAKGIHYDRKVELLDLIHDKEKQDRIHADLMEKKADADKDATDILR